MVLDQRYISPEEELTTDLDFTHFKRRKRGSPQVGGTERSGVPEYRGRRPTVKTLRRQPQAPPHQGDGVDEGRRRLVVPGRGALGHGAPVLQGMCGQGGPGEEPQQDRSGACDGQVLPLTLGLHAQMGPHLLKGDLSAEADQRSTNHCSIRVGSAAGSVQCSACGAKEPWGSRISTQRMGTGNLPGRYQTAVREVSSTVRVAPSYQATAELVQVVWG